MSVSWPLVGVFLASAAACFAVAAREPRLGNPDSRRGLRWLLLVVGVWGALQTGGLLVTDESTAAAIYALALAVGFATIGPWLYFCSAYTGHDYHRRRPYRLAAVGVYVVVVAAKLTNPIHGQYFAATIRREPTRLLLIDQGPLYWGSFALAYLLTGIGFVFLYRLYRQSARPPWTLAGLFAATGVASVPKLVDLLAPDLIPALTYEPVGVAVFAVGTTLFAEERFVAEERATRRSIVERAAGGILVVDADGFVTEWNEAATAVFPPLDTDDPPVAIETLSSSLAADYDAGRPTLVETPVDEETRTYLATSHPLEVGTETFGYTLLLQDVTTFERQRERRKRHEQQLADMSGAIAHELRNSVTVANGYLDVAVEQLDADDPAAARDSVATAQARVRRIERSVEDLHTLVRYTHDAGEETFVDLERTLRAAAKAVPEAPLIVVRGEGAVLAAPTRLKHLLRNAVRFAAYNGASTLTLTVRPDGFDVADDGRHDTEGRDDHLFAYESAEPTADAGMALPNVRALAETEGWTVSPDPSYTDGVKYAIRGVRVQPAEDDQDAGTDVTDVDATRSTRSSVVDRHTDPSP